MTNVIERPYNTRNIMHNQYYQVNERIDVDAWIKDCVVCPYLAQEIIEEGYMDEYDGNGHFALYVNIIEAFGKTWVCLNQYGDRITTVHVNFDGEVIGSSHGIPSLDLDDKCYYVGDEPTHMGYMDKFEHVSQWVWKGFELDCKVVQLQISTATMKRFVEMRKDYLIDQADKA